MCKTACKNLSLKKLLLQLSFPLLGLSLLIISDQAQAQLEPSVRYQETDYQLCAKQRVTKALLFDVVDVGVYYPDCKQAADIFDDQPKLLRFSYLRDVTGDQFTEGADDFLRDNLEPPEKDQCLTYFNEFNTVYKDVTDGDYYDLFVLPEQGLDLYLNNQQLAQSDNSGCALPYLNIWFGEESMDGDFEDLRDKIKALN